MTCSTLQSAPNFFILGAAKCGTTSLYKYLSQHPDVYFPVAKEPQFFSNDEEYKKGFDYYLGRFFAGVEKFKLRGDATPHYLYYEKAAERISKLQNSENIKFIIILRNPVDRAYSLYWNMVAEGYETLTFEEALRSEPQRQKEGVVEALGSVRYQYVDSGLYAKQLKAYYKYFNKNQFLVLFHDDLKKNPSTVMESVAGFLGLSEMKYEISESHNASGVSRSFAVQHVLRGDFRIKRWLGKLLPFTFKYHIVNFLLKMNKKKKAYTPMTTEVRNELVKTFNTDIEELEKSLDVDLSEWKKLSKSEA